jgi:hypothetical protein
MPRPPHEGTFTTSDGVTIAFTRRPAPDAHAPRIVLIHSLALDRSVWDGVVDTMKNEAEILTSHRSACLSRSLSARKITPLP